MIRRLDPAFGKRSPANALERALIVPVRMLTAVLRWLTRRLQ
jgi:hypothetical protein